MSRLNQRQLDVIEEVLRGGNVFVCGIAGTGKSSVIEGVLSRSLLTREEIGVCAPTWCAAKLLPDGVSVHDFFGTGPLSPADKIDDVLARVRGNAKVVSRLLRVKLIIIDEMSMVANYVLNILKCILERIRKSELDYGGVQMFLIGDLKQLPPFVDSDQDEANTVTSDQLWCFVGEPWQKLNIKCFVLEEIVRTADPVLQGIVRNVSNGELTEANKQVLHNHKKYMNNIIPQLAVRNGPALDNAVLCATNEQVREVNGDILEYLADKKGATIVNHSAFDEFDKDLTEDKKYKLLADAGFAEQFEVCRGAPVMYVGTSINVLAYHPQTKETRLVHVVNGTRGIMEDYGDDSFVRQRGEANLMGLIGKVPQKVEALQVSIGGGFRVFVGLAEETVGIEGASLTRTQFPVVVCFAMTIHKSQGQTFQNVHIYMKNYQFFTRGLFYVAISRLTSMKGLTIETNLSLGSIDIRVSEQVRLFMATGVSNGYRDSRKRKLEDL